MARKNRNSSLIIISKIAVLTSTLFYLFACALQTPLWQAQVVTTDNPLIVNYDIEGSLTKKLSIEVFNPANYATLSLYANDELVVDSIDVPSAGNQVINTLVCFNVMGKVKLRIKVTGADLTLNKFEFTDITDLDIPLYEDISIQAGIDKVNSIKYGGPTIADIDNDGDYDFIVNNHNEADSKLYWNNGDGTVTAHDKNLSRWFMHDLHGTAAGDFDNDGDLDLVVTQGGGNGKNPSTANFYQNNNGTLVLITQDVGIDKGGRGRGARWSDMDLDGDLDLMLINELGLAGEKPQHFFYENMGNASFKYRPITGLQDVHPSRVLMTDINNDYIDDIILFGPLSIWKGNGDFTFTDVTSTIPDDIAALKNIMAVADIDIDNDGDLDLYLARGKAFEGGFGETPSMDFDPMTKEFSIKPRGFKGIDSFDFRASGAIKLHAYDFLAQGVYRDKDYPLFLGKAKTVHVLAKNEDIQILPAMAQGWPADISANGMYFGHIGNGNWKAALVRNGDIFWGFTFSLSGIDSVTPHFVPQNRNESDILLRNDGDKFTDVSTQWNIQPGGNSLGVTVGDFNNDSFQDVFVSRWGFINAKTSDYMLLNNGRGQFETVTMHGANDIGGPGNGDMGQAFDFNLDGSLDLLNGSEGGQWYLYANKSNAQTSERHNYALVRVGYSPVSNIDAISAVVTLKTASHSYRKRVASAGEVFSQSLLNIVHFGLGEEEKIESIRVRWRDGTSVDFANKTANALYDTNKLDPKEISFLPKVQTIRQGASTNFIVNFSPKNADQSLLWSSSDESVLTVDNHGVVTAIGDVNSSALISASSLVSDASTSNVVSIVEWFAQPLKSIDITNKKRELIAGEKLVLQTTLLPTTADNKALTWTSSDHNVAVVDNNGVLNALEAGSTTIKASSTLGSVVSNPIEINVEPLVQPFITIRDADKISQADFVVGDKIVLNVDYHAGTGNTVIASDEGGVRFWLRHFKYKWIPEKDIVLTDSSALKTESGTSSMALPTDGLRPTAELPDGQFYYLRASFTASDGNAYEAQIYPINLVSKKTE